VIRTEIRMDGIFSTPCDGSGLLQCEMNVVAHKQTFSVLLLISTDWQIRHVLERKVCTVSLTQLVVFVLIL
jgi:hypothetical protein